MLGARAPARRGEPPPRRKRTACDYGVRCTNTGSPDLTARSDRKAEDLAHLVGRGAVREDQFLGRVHVAGLGSLGAGDGDLHRRVDPEGEAANDVVQERVLGLDHSDAVRALRRGHDGGGWHQAVDPARGPGLGDHLGGGGEPGVDPRGVTTEERERRQQHDAHPQPSHRQPPCGRTALTNRVVKRLGRAHAAGGHGSPPPTAARSRGWIATLRRSDGRSTLRRTTWFSAPMARHAGDASRRGERVSA